MSKNIVIELADNALDKVREVVKNGKGEPLLTSEIPAERIELITKNYFSSVEQMRADMLPLATLANPERIKAVEKVIQDYANAPIKVEVVVKENTVEVKVTTSYSHPLMKSSKPLVHFKCTEGKVAPEFYASEYSSNPMFTVAKSQELCSIIREVLDFLDKPTTIQTVVNTKQAIKPKANGKKKVNRKKANVRYVYKTVHRIVNVDTESKASRKKYAEREWNKEEWTRQGHYRTYRSKTTGQIIKQIWIEPTVCRAHGKVKENQNLKITKMD